MERIKVISLIIMLFSLAACGQSSRGEDVDVGFTPYLEAFKSEAAAHNTPIHADFLNTLTIKFGDAAGDCKQKNAVACCHTHVELNTISIDSGYWDRSDENARYELIFHEMGHCFLGREHKDDKDANGHPLSIMYSKNFNGDYFAKHINEYTRELFSK